MDKKIENKKHLSPLQHIILASLLTIPVCVYSVNDAFQRVDCRIKDASYRSV